MTKRKRSEEDIVELNSEEGVGKVAAPTDEAAGGNTGSLGGRHVEGGTVREVPSERPASTPNPTATPERESETKAFWALLATARYTVW